jgi:outer membrane protein OmpA-like peptidoglycan-associated protein
MPRPAPLVTAAALALTATVGLAAADPVTYQLRGDVPVGKKPELLIHTDEPATDLQLDLTRDDGKRFKSARPSLGKGQAVTLPIGDGAAGKASYQGKLTVHAAGKLWTFDLSFPTQVRAPLKIAYDAAHLDLEQRKLEFKPSRPIERAELTVRGDDGKELATAKAGYGDGPPPDGWLPISWSQPAGTTVMTMTLRAIAGDGTITTVELVPWSVTVAHEDVTFTTDSAAIAPSEQAKLDASLAKITETVTRAAPYLKVALYVAGHTDTVGPGAKNRTLSLGRARAIAAYFRQHGLTAPIAYAGFGEDVPKVKTADATDEPANRRADYVLGPAGGAPPFTGPYLAAHASWQQLP